MPSSKGKIHSFCGNVTRYAYPSKNEQLQRFLDERILAIRRAMAGHSQMIGTDASWLWYASYAPAAAERLCRAASKQLIEKR